MDMQKLIDDLTTVKASALTKESEITALKASKTELEGKITELGGKISALTAENDTLKAGDAAKLSNELASAKAFLRLEADRLCVASGTPVLKPEATVAELSESITTNRVKLSAALGRSEGSATGTGTGMNRTTGSAVASSFKTV